MRGASSTSSLVSQKRVKNLITISTAAILSVGGKWPDGTQAPLGDTIIWSGEDAFEYHATEVPGTGGDRRRIFNVPAVVNDDDGCRSIRLAMFQPSARP